MSKFLCWAKSGGNFRVFLTVSSSLFKLKEDYYQLLKDTPDVNRDSRWRDVRPKIEHDPRYIAVDSNARREDWFRDYVRDLRVSIKPLLSG